MLNEGGGVIEDLIVYRLGEERYFVVPNAANAHRVLRMLEEETADGPLHLMYHQDWCFLAVQGPESVHVMAGLFPEAAELAFMQCDEAEYRRRPVIVTRSGYTGEVGFELFTYQDVARELWRELLESVEPFDGGPAGLAARDVLRLEMGYPLYGQDLFESSTALEAGLGWAVAMRQGRVPGTRRAGPSARRGAPEPACGGCGCRSAGTSHARTTRCSSAISSSARSRAAPSRRCSARASRSRTCGREMPWSWGRRSRSTSEGDVAPRPW